MGEKGICNCTSANPGEVRIKCDGDWNRETEFRKFTKGEYVSARASVHEATCMAENKSCSDAVEMNCPEKKTNLRACVDYFMGQCKGKKLLTEIVFDRNYSRRPLEYVQLFKSAGCCSKKNDSRVEEKKRPEVEALYKIISDVSVFDPSTRDLPLKDGSNVVENRERLISKLESNKEYKILTEVCRRIVNEPADTHPEDRVPIEKIDERHDVRFAYLANQHWRELIKTAAALYLYDKGELNDEYFIKLTGKARDKFLKFNAKTKFLQSPSLVSGWAKNR